MRHPEAVDASSVALFLQPRKLLLPPDEVVHLLDLDPAEPPELVGKLAAAFLDRARPDLRCDRRLPTLAAERSGKRLLRCGIHWGRVEEESLAAALGSERGKATPHLLRCGIHWGRVEEPAAR